MKQQRIELEKVLEELDRFPGAVGDAWHGHGYRLQRWDSWNRSQKKAWRWCL
ncbi:hypothetical protein HRED_09892 [Candidatus Haloredivivus sp. G17]|nr:hypothetical protein HRED_09892 [Candidatus Haloredivivus sp. G17]